MELKDIISIFPDAQLQPTPNPDAAYLSLPVAAQWLNIPRTNLTSREITLLQLMIDKAAIPRTKTANDHTWFRRLFLGEKVSQQQLKSQRVRVIQINLVSHDNSIPVNNWLDAFKTMFKQPFLDTFLINNHEAIAIEPLGSKIYDNDNFLGISQALDSDFYCSSKIYVGQYWQNDNTIEQLFTNERNLFKFQLQQNTSDRLFSISNSILKYYFKTQLSQNPLILKSDSELFNMPEAKKTITTLYQNGGNVSNTAKKMFLHRNTLQYRIKKFQETTGFNLKNMDDLLFCYLLTFQ
ncbi:helix-turn-helix domain-containing protein [Levilactobacillus fujinensis]|uniref:helix-turn-helix domain-containing protein n=1 Tax=Levilactobacillus fujinensis TaxID=2486024 RepID=UPI0013DE08A9|nr:helix-turn-helix domain-containing protein [Levilactobacillus fujinensis]